MLSGIRCASCTRPIWQPHMQCPAARASRCQEPADVSCHTLPSVVVLLSASKPSLLLSSLCASCGQSPQPCCAVQRSCSWAQLSLCSACQELCLGPGARPSSAAQHPTMASLALCPWAPSRCPQGLRADSSQGQQGLCWGVLIEADQSHHRILFSEEREDTF